MQFFREVWTPIWLVLGLGGIALYAFGLRASYLFLQNGVAYKNSTLARFILNSTLITLLVALTSANSIFAGFGPGAWMWVSMLVITPSFGFLTLKAVKKWRYDRQHHQVNWSGLFVGVIVANVLTIAPHLGETAIAQQCDKVHQAQLEPLIAGVETYRLQEGIYPTELNILFPNYVQSRPMLRCFWGATDGYWIQECSNDHYILVLANYAGGFDLRYNPVTSEWSRISRLDGTCSFLD